ncbi:MAG: response regulator, partial [Flavobacteriaceae bacterium]|nr:response regulator [Flavobacteriaceae bacterium]
IDKNGVRSFYPNSNPPLPAETVWCLFKSDDDSHWLGTGGNGLIQFNPFLGVLQQYNTTNSLIPSNNIRVIVAGVNNELWLGTDNEGLVKFNTLTKQFDPYKHESTMKIKSLYFDAPFLWIGTNGSGLNVLHTETGELKSFTTSDGLPNNVIYGILSDENENLWLSSNRGITKFKYDFSDDSIAITNYDTGDGLQAMEFNTGASFKSDEGILYFGGLNGINWFQPNAIGGNTAAPNTAINKLEVFSEEAELIPFKKFPSGENTLSFTFSSLHFSQPQNNQFKYRLINYENDWSKPSTVNVVHYPKLPAGEYTFQVTSSNYEDVWDQSPASYSFSIKPVWYWSTIAKISYILIFLLSMYLIYLYLRWKWKIQLRLQMEHDETERLRKLDELKTKLYTNISHEFRTPLTLISAPIQQLLGSTNLKDPDRKSIQIIEGSSKRLLRLVNQLLDLSKLETGAVQLQVGRYELKPQLLQLVEAFSLSAEKRKIKIQTEIDDFEDSYYDKDVMEKVVSNLLSNAVKYAPEGSVIQFVAIEKSGELHLKTTNKNETLTNKEIGKLFDRFYQADKHSKGVGVGLALIKELVLLCNGNMSAFRESKSYISFKVEIPIKKYLYHKDFIIATPSENNLIPNEENTLQTKGSNENTQILIVEDNDEIRNYIVSLFSEKFDVSEAKNGQEGIDHAISTIPDLIISDIMMPEKDGIELCNFLKSDRRTSHIPIILLTAKSGEDDELKGLTNKADDYIIKPFNAQVLMQKVINLIESRRQLRQRYSDHELLKPKDIAFTPVDVTFLESVQELMDEKLTDSSFNAEIFASRMNMSRMQLHRKIKALTGLSTTEFIRSQRLKAALELLKSSGLNVNDVAYTVGFNTPSYFIKCFKKVYGKTPSQYIKT